MSKDALDLAAEIGVPWRIDDIDAGAVPDDRGDLGEDGDAALALEIVGIHSTLGHPLVLAEGARLLEQAVDEGRLPMVDMGNDGDIAKVHGIKMRERGPKWPALPMTGIYRSCDEDAMASHGGLTQNQKPSDWVSHARIWDRLRWCLRVTLP